MVRRSDGGNTMEFFQLREGNKIPVIGFGPDEMGYSPRRKKLKADIVHKGLRKIKRKFYDEPEYIRKVESAFKAGFSLLDWSSAYGDGRLILKSLKKCGIKRENLILTTRISNKAQFKGNIREEFDRQLKGFNTDYFDILMFHWPVTGHFQNTWEEMMGLREEGYCKILGVANCHQSHLEAIYNVGGIS